MHAECNLKLMLLVCFCCFSMFFLHVNSDDGRARDGDDDGNHDDDNVCDR